jgi:pyruvate dehydrogenase E1 component
MPAMPEGCEEGILRGMYRLREADAGDEQPRVALLGSGPILNEALEARELLQGRYGVAAEVWSVTSYKQLYLDALESGRNARLAPDEGAEPPYLTRCLQGTADVIVAASDYVKALPYSLAHWMPAPFVGLGTDGFGRSDSRQALRRFFEVDARHIAFAALSRLVREGKLPAGRLTAAREEMEIESGRADPVTV